MAVRRQTRSAEARNACARRFFFALAMAAASAAIGCSSSSGDSGDAGGSGSSSGSGGSGGNDNAYCEVHDSKGHLSTCTAISNDAAHISAFTSSCPLDAGGSTGMTVSSCPSAPTGCCYTTQTFSGNQVSDYTCYYENFTASSIQSICSMVANTQFAQSPPY